MRRIIKLIVITFLFINHSIFAESIKEIIDFKCISTDFNGSVSNGKLVLIYGKNGVVLLTKDFDNWEQINFDVTYDILKIVAVENYFFALTNNGIIYSTDEARNWQKLNLPEDVYEIFAYKNSLIIVTNNKVKTYEISTNETKDYTLKLDSSYFKPTIYKNITISAVILKNKIYFYSKDWKLGVLDLSNFSFKEIFLDEIFPYKHYPLREKLFSNQKNLLFLTVDSNFFEYDIEKNSIRKIFSKPVNNDSLIVYFAYDNDLFFLYNKTYSVLNADSVSKSLNIDSLFFGNIDKSNQNLVYLEKPETDRHICNLRFNELNKVNLQNNEYWLAVGNDKLILISTDQGKHWQVKSLLNENGKIFHFGQNLGKMITETGKFFSTTNGGITWLPQKNYVPSIIRNNYKVAFFLDSLRGFIWSSSFSTRGNNFYYTLDGGENVLFKKIEPSMSSNYFIQPYQKNIYVSFATEYKKYRLTYFFVLDQNFEVVNKFVHTDTLWQSLQKSFIQIVDSLYFTHLFIVNDLFFGMVKENNEISGNVLKFYISKDTFKTFNSRIFYFPYTILTKFYLKDDTLIMLAMNEQEPQNPHRIMFWHLSNTPKIVKTIDIPNNFYYSYFISCEKIYLLSLVFADKIYNNLVELNLQDSKLTEINFEFFNDFLPVGSTLGNFSYTWNFSDSAFTLAFNSSKSNLPVPLLFWFKSKPCDILSNVQLDEQFNDYLYVTNPYPTPSFSQNNIQLFVYHDVTISPNDLDFKVLDILGNDLTKNVNISFYQISNYSTKLNLNFNYLPNGCYLINVKAKSKSKFVKILLYK